MLQQPDQPQTTEAQADDPLWRTPLPFQSSDNARLTGGPEYRFVQALTAEVAYRSLLRAERTRLHRAVAEALEVVHEGRIGPWTPVLAHHFERGSVPDRASQYWIDAARRAKRDFSNVESVHAYRRAIDITDTLDDIDAGRLSQLHEELGDVYFVTSEYESARDAYASAMQTRGDDARLLRKTGQVYQKWGRHADALEQLERARERIGEDGDDNERANVYAALGLCLHHAGEVEEAISLARRALAIMKSRSNDRGMAHTSNNLAIMLYKRGEFDAALEAHELALTLREKTKDLYGQASSHNNIGLVCRSRGDRAAAIEHFERSLALFEEIGNRHGQARALDNLGETLDESGDRERAMTYIGRAVAILSELSTKKTEIEPEMWQSGVW